MQGASLDQLNWLKPLVKALILPPTGPLLVAAFGLWLRRYRPRTGSALAVLGVATLLALSVPVVASLLMRPLDVAGVIDLQRARSAQAIVILGGGTRPDAVEYGGDTVGRFTLERVRYGAWLARKLDKPVLVTGGNPDGGRPEGQLMRETLEREFGVKVRWVEDRSETTRENARYSAALLKEAGIGRIYLVSHAWHLPRALPEFEREGLRVVPAGTGYSRTRGPRPLDFVPNAKGLYDSYLAMHEGIGLVWYRIRN